jgi:hypothetical protein
MEAGRRARIHHTFPASPMSSSRLLPQTARLISDIFISMKTRKLTDVLERIEAWPPEMQDVFAERALELDADVRNGNHQPMPEELAGRERTLCDIAEVGKRRYESIRENLERDHFGAYVMINTDTSEYMIAPTISQVHGAFIERFGEDAPIWWTRIGVSVFASI